MTTIEIRPRFRREYAMKPQEILEKLDVALAYPGSTIRGMVVDHHVVLKIPFDRQHYWSPQLSLEVEEKGSGSLVRGLFGPRPSVWLLFVFLYALIGVLALFISITGFSQVNLGLSAPALWALPFLGIFALVLYLAAQAGKRLGHDEMEELIQFFESSILVSKEEVERKKNLKV